MVTAKVYAIVQNKVLYKLERYIKYFWTLELHKVVILNECSQGLKD